MHVQVGTKVRNDSPSSHYTVTTVTSVPPFILVRVNKKYDLMERAPSPLVPDGALELQLTSGARVRCVPVAVMCSARVRVSKHKLDGACGCSGGSSLHA